MKAVGSIGMVCLCFSLWSCGSGGSDQKPEEQKEIKLATEQCSYAYNNDATVKWTAFKFTDKVGVGGSLDSVIIRSKKKVEDPRNLLEGLQFDIYTNSVNSSNEDRDKKIVEHFFGTMNRGEVISGKVLSLTGDAKSGTANISLTMNGETTEQDMKYFVNGAVVSINGTVDMAKWNATASVDALNEVCKDLHTGEDGLSKLWTTVDIEVVSTLLKECK